MYIYTHYNHRVYGRYDIYSTKGMANWRPLAKVTNWKLWGMVWTTVLMWSQGEEPVWSGFLTRNDTHFAYPKRTRHALRGSDWQPILSMAQWHPKNVFVMFAFQCGPVSVHVSLCPGCPQAHHSRWACSLKHIYLYIYICIKYTYIYIYIYVY